MVTPSLLADLTVCGIVGVICLHMLSLKARGRFVVLDPLNAFWAGAGVLYVYQPIAHGELLIEWYDTGVFEETLLVTLFGIVMLVVGYELPLGNWIQSRMPNLPARVSPRLSSRFAIALIVFGCLGYHVQFQSAGGLSVWAATARGGTDWTTVSSYWGAVSALLPAGVILLLIQAEMHRSTGARRAMPWLLSLMLLSFFFYLGSRSRIIALVGAGLMAYYLPRRRNPSLLLVGAAFSALFVISNFLAQYRGRFTDFAFNSSGLELSEVAAASLPVLSPNSITGQRSAVSRGLEFSCTMAVVDLVPEVIPFNLGYSQLEFFTRPIPRAIWPEKRYPHYEAFTPIYEQSGLSDSWVSYASVPILAGPAFGYIGHWYAVGGAIALVLAGVGTGAIFRSLRGLYDRPSRGDGDLIVYALTIVPVGFGDAASTPLFWIFTLPLALAPVALLLWFAKAR